MSSFAKNELSNGLQSTVAEEPRIYLIARPTMDFAAVERFLQDESTDWRRSPGSSSAEELVEVAGRLCYMSFGTMQSPRQNYDYIQNLLRQEHESVLEHASWTFILTGISRAFTHQLVRHRVGFSYSQLSQQYHDETAVRFVVPHEIRTNSEALRQWLRTMEELRWAYQAISTSLDQEEVSHHGAPREARRAIRSAARSILPNAAETKIVVTANSRSLRHFLRLRGAIIGDVEMRKVSALIYGELKREAPSLLTGFQLVTHEDGLPLTTYIETDIQAAKL